MSTVSNRTGMYTMDAEQQTMVERAFLLIPERDGQRTKYERINERCRQLALEIFGMSPKGPEQTIALRKLQEFRLWAIEAIRLGEK